MSVLIKGMEMPHNCDECWIPCAVEFQDRNYLSRPKCCPCFEVKIPHGRLIDADALNYSNTDYCGNHFVYMVDIEDSPAIIESEKEDG